MNFYYMDTSENQLGQNEVHTEDCYRLPPMGRRRYFGQFPDARRAVRYAREHGYAHANGCRYCSPEGYRRPRLSGKWPQRQSKRG